VYDNTVCGLAAVTIYREMDMRSWLFLRVPFFITARAAQFFA
jgi:hypothetical protein